MDEKMKEIINKWKVLSEIFRSGWDCKVGFDKTLEFRFPLLKELPAHIKALEKDLIDRDAKIGIYLMDILKEQNLTKEWYRRANKAEAKVKELEEGIKKFKNRHKRKTSYYEDTLLQHNQREIEAEEELYGLMEETK